MNLDPLSFSLTEISYLIANITKKNFKQTSQELSQIVLSHGLEADRHLIRQLLGEAERGLWESERATPASGCGVHVSLLAQQPAALLNHPARTTVLCHPLDFPTSIVQKNLKPSNTLFSRLARLYKLTTVQEVAFCLALRNTTKPEIIILAQQHLRKRFLDLVQCYLDTDSGHQAEGGGLQDCSPEVLQVILSSLSHESFGLAIVTKELFLQRLRRDFPRDLVPVILAPLLYPDDTENPLEEMTSVEDMAGAMMEQSLADFVREIGYPFTTSVEECKNTLVNLSGRDLSAGDVARIISMMIRYHTGLQDGPPIQAAGNFWLGHDSKKEAGMPHAATGEIWNSEVFVQALKELTPSLNWKEVILELDHPEFIVTDRHGISLLFTILRLGLQSAGYPANIFPVEYLCRHWTNLEGQMSLITNILKYPDVFSFVDYPFHPVSIDILKSPPETDNKEISTWRCLYLVELLLYASERGYYIQVHDLFKFPIQHCPDILLLALLQINPPITMVRQELLTNLIPIFLGNHPNSGIILHHAWHTQNPNIKPIIMHAMAEWYIRGDNDQSRLSRILDVAQDLKALSLLLNVQSFLFVIDLACLASRREYLKLDKWLTDKIRDHGENFVSAMVKFLQRRCPQVMGGKIPEEQLPKAAQLPPETITTMLACLHLCINNVQPDLSDAILAVIANCTLIINKSRQAVQGIARAHRVLETPFNPAGLGAQIFTAPSVDAMTTLGPNIANMNLGAPAANPFTLPGTLGPLVSTPGSPSRLIGAGPNSPFAIMPLQHAPNMPNMSGLRMGPAPAIDKPRLPENPIHFPEIAQNVSKEIEDEANGYFQRIYNHPPHPTLSIDEVLDMLKKFQDSPNKREREVFSCMLRNLFEEYKFFPQYPDKELQITAQLFGGIIERGLVPSYVSLGLALRFVLDALRKPDGSKMYFFGIAALDRFKSRLKDYHKYCEHVRAIPHFNEFPAHLIEYVEYGLQSQEPPTKPQGPVLPTSFPTILTPNAGTIVAPYRTPMINAPPSMSVISKLTTAGAGLGSRPSIANATNIDTLLGATDRDEKIMSPPEGIQDKTAFIFNNLSQLNLQTKCDELRDIITDEYHPWLSQYLVMKRASIELNFHALYSNFLDVLKVPDVNKLVTKETFRNIKVLLRSDKGIANFSDRSLLKNLGHWLGMLTLGRNRPILQIDIDLKALLLEAYHKGQQELLYVVPFVAKVLESCAKSRVFKPPNPWTMGIMNVLAELHQEPDLKLNLKFEIEVLCKNLSIDVVDLKPAIYLKDPEKVRQLEYQLSHPNKKEASNIAINQSIPPPQVQTPMIQQPTIIATEEMAAAAATPTSGLHANDPNIVAIVSLPEPRFSYMDINVSSTSTFGQNISINPHIILFQNYPHLKQFIKPAIERSIQEWIHPVVDRSIKYALTTCEQIVRKDFALDPDDVRMRTSAHHMMRNLTAGMAMITCREQLITTISTNLKTAFLTALIPATPQQKEIVEAAAAILASENMELACAFIQKTAVEKALPELDKRLLNDYEVRKLARQEARRYCDTVVLSYQGERMPERVRLKVGGVNESQIAVYEEFARNIPGFIPLKDRDAAIFIPKPVAQETIPLTAFNQTLNPNQMIYGADEMSRLINDAELFLANTIGVATLAVQTANMHSLLECLILARRNRDVVSACTLLQKAVEGLLDGLTVAPGSGSDQVEAISRYRDIHTRALKLLQDTRAYGHLWTTKQITRCLTECREEMRYNLDAVDWLIRSHLVNMPQYDLALAQSMDNGNNYMAVAFSMQLVQLYLVDERMNMYVTEADLYNTIDILIRIVSHSRQPPPEGLASLIEVLRLNQDPANFLGDRPPTVGPTAHIHSGILQVRARDYDDPPGLNEKTDYLIREWMTLMYNQLTSSDIPKTFNIFVHRLNMHGILKTDDMITRFFRIATQLCVDNVYSLLSDERLNPPPAPVLRSKYYNMSDAFIKLVSLLVKNSGDSGNTLSKINLLNKVLGIIAGCLMQDHEEHGTSFQQLPYHRLFLILFLDLNQPEPVLESINFQVLTAFCHTFHILRPNVVPGFCFAWLELVAHRAFISRVLAVTPQQKGWGMYSQLLVDLFKYLEPFLRNTELAKPVTVLYKGTLKVLLVLLHDFPEFLCDYHYGFCDEIPPNCIQMRNLILSAFPRNMRLPDPFTPNLKVDLLAEISLPPRVVINYTAMIQSPQFKKDLDSYLKARAPVTFLSELRSNMQISNEPGRRYNTQLMNAVVLYVGTQAIAFIRGKGQTPNMSTIAHSAHMDIFQNLAVDLDNEGRYLFFNAIANQLRYPNSHTHYFSCALLYLFAEANTEAIQEQITRMLLERLIVNRPHPWGLLITFIELIKNPNYKFWDHDFVHCAPEIEKLFESVARSCLVDKTVVSNFDDDVAE